MKKNGKRLLAAMLLLTVLICSSFSVAAAVKKTVKAQSFTLKTSVAKSKAATVKRGTTNLTVKKGHGYIRFVAPVTKTYSFTFSDVKSKSASPNAYVEVQKPGSTDTASIGLTKVTTAGGKSNTLWLSVNGYKYKKYKGTLKPIASRTGRIKLKKGESIYFYFSCGNTKTTAKLKIK